MLNVIALSSFLMSCFAAGHQNVNNEHYSGGQGGGGGWGVGGGKEGGRTVVCRGSAIFLHV